MEHPDREIWDGMLAHLRGSHPTLCRAWFTQITPIGVEGGAMLLRASSDVQRDYLRRECLDAFNDAARTATESLIAIRFLGPDDDAPGATQADRRDRTPGRDAAIDHDPHATPADTSGADADTDSDTEPNGAGAERREPAPSPAPGSAPGSAPGRIAGKTDHPASHTSNPPRTTNFTTTERTTGDHDTLIVNPDNGFENFVVGPGNRLAHAAAIAVAANPGHAYNPFFVHGDVGLGKTHLLQAICVSIHQNNPAAVIHYVSCDTFINEFMYSVAGGQMSDFRHRFRDVDVLVIDDIHFLSERDRTQEEFFHTFNSLYQFNKQIVLSSDAPPEEIPNLEDRLVSRFKWGLVARVDPPGFETRIAILQSKARLRGLDMPGDVAAFVAGRIDTNIRELEGAVVQLQLAASVEKVPITLDLARATLGDARPRAVRTPTIDEIIQGTCEQFDVRRTDLLGKRRHQSIALPRQVCMALARQHTRHSFEEIGASIGGRDHTTVMHACKAIEARRSGDPDLDAAVRAVERAVIGDEPRPA